jgi:predicted O-methyltransferase YrrM
MIIPDRSYNHRDLVVQLAQINGWKRGAELGLGDGLLFETLLAKCPDLHMVGVDVFPWQDRLDRLTVIADRFGPRAELMHATTRDAAELVLGGTFDFVFVDADHSYASVKDDIARWWPKVKPGGWLMGDDHYWQRFPGVCRAVYEAFGTDIIVLPHAVWARPKAA